MNGNGSFKNGGTLPKTLSYILGGGGTAALLGAFLLNIHSQASIALSVAEQHGQEFLLVRQEIAAIKLILEEKTRSRYTAVDAQRDMDYLERRIREVEEGCVKKAN